MIWTRHRLLTRGGPLAALLGDRPLLSLFYAQLLSVLYKDATVLNRIVAGDPLISLKQAVLYWTVRLSQRVAGLAGASALSPSSAVSS